MTLHGLFKPGLIRARARVELRVKGIDHEMIVMGTGWWTRPDITGFTSPVRSLHPTLETFRDILHRGRSFVFNLTRPSAHFDRLFERHLVYLRRTIRKSPAIDAFMIRHYFTNVLWNLS